MLYNRREKKIFCKGKIIPRHCLCVAFLFSVQCDQKQQNSDKKKIFTFSGIENKNDIYTCGQLEASTPGLKKDGEVKTEIITISETPKAITVPSKAYTITTIPIKTAPRITPIIKENRPRSVTASVFAPVTEIPASLLELQQQLTRCQQHQTAATVTASLFSPNSSASSSSSTHRHSLFKQQIATRGITTTIKSQTSATPDTMNKGYLMFLAEGSDLTSKYMSLFESSTFNFKSNMVAFRCAVFIHFCYMVTSIFFFQYLVTCINI